MRTKKTTRLHLDMSPKCRKRLEAIAESSDLSLSEVMRRAIALFDLVSRESKNGSTLIIRSENSEREIVLL